MGAALVLENAQIPAVKLQLVNQASGQLTLKSGKFEFVGDTALVNDGTLTQHSAYTLYLIPYNMLPKLYERIGGVSLPVFFLREVYYIIFSQSFAKAY